jgi:DNA-binding transcriptional LysR family regulator
MVIPSIPISYAIEPEPTRGRHAVAAEASVSKAADRLMVSQPAVSKQLREFERQLGTPLFDRLPRGVRPTEAGALLADYARRIFALADEAQERLAELRGLERGQLRIGASTTIAVYLLPAVFVAFRTAYPGVRLAVDIVNAREVEDRLAAGAVDVALSEGEPDAAAFAVDPFMTDELIAIAPAGHPLAGGGSRSRRPPCAGSRSSSARPAAAPGRSSSTRWPTAGWPSTR